MKRGKRYIIVNLTSVVLVASGLLSPNSWLAALGIGMIIGSNVV